MVLHPSAFFLALCSPRLFYSPLSVSSPVLIEFKIFPTLLISIPPINFHFLSGSLFKVNSLLHSFIKSYISDICVLKDYRMGISRCFLWRTSCNYCHCSYSTLLLWGEISHRHSVNDWLRPDLNLSKSDWNSNTLATWCKELTRKRPWCWERLRAEGEGDDRGWDGWMASSTRWTWV